MKAQNFNLEIEQGATFLEKFNWYGGGRVDKEIGSVAVGCPTRITIVGHGLSSGADTPIYIDGVKGASNLNTKGKEVVATFVDVDNFDVVTNTRGKTYTANTGCIYYFLPESLTGYTARMQIMDAIDDTATLVSLTSAGGDIVINTATAEIQVTISATVTAALDFDEGVYDMELEDGAGVVTRLIEGKMAFVKEVTR